MTYIDFIEKSAPKGDRDAIYKDNHRDGHLGYCKLSF